MSWRIDILRLIKTARRLERVARRTELPFEVRPSWPGIDWCEHNETLEAFSERVKLVASRIGSPDSVESRYWLGAVEGFAPDLVATWKLVDKDGTHVEATVRALSPKGCKIHPDTKLIKEQQPEIHPECAAVLRGLEDL